jgi:hypothetical protein
MVEKDGASVSLSYHYSIIPRCQLSDNIVVSSTVCAGDRNGGLRPATPFCYDFQRNMQRIAVFSKPVAIFATLAHSVLNGKHLPGNKAANSKEKQ